MENEDLADLLERELALMDDVDDEEEDAIFESDFLKRKELDEIPHTTMDEELQQLLLSASALPSLRDEPDFRNVETPDERADEPPESSHNLTDSLPLYTIDHDESPVSTELSEEEKQTITDLMTLMIESVERCAPILERTTLSPVQHAPSVPLVLTSELTLISDDSQVTIDAPPEPSNSVLDRTQEISLLDSRLANEAKLNNQAKIISTQRSDQVVWDETKRFKQALEEERARIEERRRRREAAKLEAQREKAAEHIQRIARGSMSRRITAPLKHQHLLTLQQLEAERINNIRRQEEALRESIRREEIKNQTKERDLMGVNEAQCRKIWDEIKKRAESQRLAEFQRMSIEDAHAAHIRQMVLQAKAKLQSYALLAAQEEEDYGLDDSGSDVSDTESEAELAMEIPNTPRAAGSNGVTSTGSSATGAARSPSIATVSLPNLSTTTKTTAPSSKQYKVAPPKTKPNVVVDPRQGRKFGGAFVNTSAGTSTSASSAVASGVSGSSGSSTGGSGQEEAVGTASHGATNNIISNNKTSSSANVKNDAHTAPPMSSTEREALHATWYAMASTANRAPSSVVYDTSGVSRAASALAMRFGEGASIGASANSDISSMTSSTSGTGVGVAGKSGGMEMIHALHHWQKWSAEYAKIVADLNTFATANTAAASTTNYNTSANVNTSSTSSTRTDTDPGLHNSMLDMHTHPTLLTELDLCVEGIVSASFLSEYTNLTKLTLNVNKITSLEGMHSLTQLVTLSIKDNKLTDIDALATLHTLKFCYLDSNKLTSLLPLNNLHSLSVLTANSNFICEMPVLQCNALTRLELCRNKITTIPPYSLRYLHNLTHLNISSNQIHTVCGETLSMCGMLQTLIFSENMLTAVPAPLRLPLLRNLRLNLNRIENVDGWVHAGDDIASGGIYPLFTPSLQKLVLSDNHLASLHPSVFTMLPLLEELDLSFNSLPARECVSGIERCKLLSALHIQDNLFTTVPVNTTAAANTRTALPQTLLLPLLHYLVDVCPTLEVVSGNRLDPKEFSERINATRAVNIRNFFLTHNAWLSPNTNMVDVVYSAHSDQFRVLLQMIQAHGAQQNIMIVKERAVKREEGNSKNTTTGNASGSTAASTTTKRDWEQETMVMLNAQLTQLLTLYSEADNNTTDATAASVAHTAGSNNISSMCVFTSYAKSVPPLVDTDTVSQAPVLSAPLPVSQGIQYEVVYLEQGGISTGGTGGTGGTGDGTGGSNDTSRAQSDSAGSFYLTQTESVSETTSHATADHTTKHVAALLIQRRYRGHHLRRKLHTALQSITYHDSELDALFNDNTDEYSDLLDMSYLEEPPMVYGDHIRKRSRPGTGKSSAGSDGGVGDSMGGSTSAGARGGIAASTDNWVLPQDTSNNPVRTSYNVKAGSGLHNIDMHTNAAAGSSSGGYYNGYGASAEAARPDTGLSAHSIDAPDRAAQSFSGASSPAHSMLSARSGLSGVTDAQSHTTRSRVTASQLGQEWGISDPRVLAAMVKRSNKIRVAENVKERRELEKDPLYRLQQFQKTAHKTPSNTIQPANTRTSGSFGGAPKTMRGAGANTKRKNMPIPAWMLGQNGPEGEES